MVNELNEQEKKDMDEMKKSLEAANQKKIEEMEAKEKEIQDALNADKEYLKKLAEENRELAEKEARRDRVDKYDQKKENFEQQAKEERVVHSLNFLPAKYLTNHSSLPPSLSFRLPFKYFSTQS